MCGMDFSWMFSIKEGAGLNRLCFCPVCRNPHRDVHGVQKIGRSSPELINVKVTNRRKRKSQAKDVKEINEGH